MSTWDAAVGIYIDEGFLFDVCEAEGGEGVGEGEFFGEPDDFPGVGTWCFGYVR